MATPQRREALNKEGRLELAVQGYKRGQFQNPTAAAKAYDVPVVTLRRRIAGTPAQRGAIAKTRLLTPTEEESLLQWILSIDKRGMPPRIATVRQMAGILAVEHGKSGYVGKNWVSKFISRHDELRSKYNRKYDYQRAKCEDPELIRGWFHCVRDTITQYGILDKDIFNFDEIGYQMGVIATAKVITGTDRAGRPRTTQPGNREWITAIESVRANGSLLPPLIIFDAVMHQAAWYNLIPPTWAIATSEKGWTTDEIGLYWLKEIFNKYAKATGRYRLLILDGHGSHVTPEFDRFCSENSIIVLCMPAHSSHLLQPLDVGCFSVLKRSYGEAVAQLIRDGVNHIDKPDFLRCYIQARTEALNERNIRSSFAATGLTPYDPDRVLTHLHTQLRTPTPQAEAQVEVQAGTPHNLRQLQHQTTLIKQYLKRRTQSPPTPTEQALNQLVKGCELAMHSALFLASENQKLQAENKRQKRKRAERRSYIARGGILTGAEAQILIENEINSQNRVEDAPPQNTRQRAPRRCSLCASLEHNARTCPERQNTS